MSINTIIYYHVRGCGNSGVALSRTGDGVGGCGEWCRLGLKISTRMSPKMIRRRRNMYFRLPVFFWYLKVVIDSH